MNTRMYIYGERLSDFGPSDLANIASFANAELLVRYVSMSTYIDS